MQSFLEHIKIKTLPAAYGMLTRLDFVLQLHLSKLWQGEGPEMFMKQEVVLYVIVFGCGSADEHKLSPYVLYKSVYLYKRWTTN